MAEVKSIYPTRVIEDLRKSGLEPADLRVRPITPADKAATGAPMNCEGYAIPYFDLWGRPIQFYRVRLFDTEVKYRQTADSQNHVYFPPRLKELLPTAKYLIITEGEKKAAKAVQEGFPCVALSGVDSWRNRTILLPKDTSLVQKSNGAVSAKVQPGGMITEQFDSLAVGMQQIIDFVTKHDIPLLICYDNDTRFGLKYEVARACATLGFELRFRGIPIKNIRHLILPTDTEEFSHIEKVGLDDFLTESAEGAYELGRAIERNLNKKSAFPRHPNPREYVNKFLQRPAIPRQQQMALAMAILSDLDARGQRLKAPDQDALYYFSNEDKSLTKVEFSVKPEFSMTQFGVQLYRDYSLSWTDQKILGWLMTLYAGEAPITDVYPEKVVTWRGDAMYYHINAGQMVKVTKDNIVVLDNGADGVLFEAGMVEDINADDLVMSLRSVGSKPLDNWWLQVLEETRIKDFQGERDSADGKQGKSHKHKQLLALLYYISPWFYKWRGTQLPVEITVGEAGSGKSTLYQLRLNMLTGVPKLRNMPHDIRDWNSSLATTGGLHVTDNVQLADPSLRQKLSDEICRLVTEPSPSIEQRKLYTDHTIIKIPVRCVFALTSIKQPFTQVDVIQRAIITELDKGVSSELTYDANWEEHQLVKYGGRPHWVAHHLIVIQRILQMVEKYWQLRYPAKYRLINVEQLLLIAARALGDPLKGAWIPEYLEGSRDQRMADADWTLEGLASYAESVKAKYPSSWERVTFTCADIAGWAEMNEEFKSCQLLINVRNLSRYMVQNKHGIATTSGIIPVGTTQGTARFKIRAEE